MTGDQKLPPAHAETYIGDGVYVSFDGWGIWLRTPRETGEHRIALDPDNFRALLNWIDLYSDLKQHMGR
jgi:hypothetical protein